MKIKERNNGRTFVILQAAAGQQPFDDNILEKINW